VAGLKAADLMTRLARGEALARQLARQQQGLGQEVAKAGGEGRGRAADQRRLAEEGRTLDDLLNRLRQDAAGTNPGLGRELRQAGEANPPGAIVERMRRAANALQAGRAGDAREDMEQSARMLDALGEQLGAARHGLVQPQLERLVALEKQAAEAQKALGLVSSEREKAEAEKRVSDLGNALEGLRSPDGKLAEAAAALAASVRNGTGAWLRRQAPHDPRLGAYVPPHEYDENLRRVIQALQVQIQETILRDALLDRDEAVPPQYRGLVEEYYRFLSEDLR
jgi:hypothetical protein